MTEARYAALYELWAAGEPAHMIAAELLEMPASDACECIARLAAGEPVVAVQEIWEEMRRYELPDYQPPINNPKVALGDAYGKAKDFVSQEDIPDGEPVVIFTVRPRHCDVTSKFLIALPTLRGLVRYLQAVVAGREAREEAAVATPPPSQPAGGAISAVAQGVFLVKRKSEPPFADRTFLWRARPVDGGFEFVRNDGRATGSTAMLPTVDFWAEFEVPAGQASVAAPPR